MTRLVTFLSWAMTLAATAAELGEPLVFTGMCGASAAVALDADLFLVADDEDNILRLYRLSQPGEPVSTYNLNPHLAGKKKSPEADIEGAARLGNRIFWITSHGRNAKGEAAPNRCRLFALEFNLNGADIGIRPVGIAYSNLVNDLTREPKLARFRLGEAAKLSAKAAGSLNIEALADTPDGALLIGFRSPVPEGRALLVPLLNPNQVIAGQSPQFGEPVRLDLGGLGLRDMGSTRHGYYLIAGPTEEKAAARLFFWPGGSSAPQPVPGLSFNLKTAVEGEAPPSR